jgi:hypothetical protein
MLRAPSKVASVETDGTVLGVTATGADLVDALRRVELGHGGLTAELELSLLAAVGGTNGRSSIECRESGESSQSNTSTKTRTSASTSTRGREHEDEAEGSDDRVGSRYTRCR